MSDLHLTRHHYTDGQHVTACVRPLRDSVLTVDDLAVTCPSCLKIRNLEDALRVLKAERDGQMQLSFNKNVTELGLKESPGPVPAVELLAAAKRACWHMFEISGGADYHAAWAWVSRFLA